MGLFRLGREVFSGMGQGQAITQDIQTGFNTDETQAKQAPV